MSQYDTKFQPMTLAGQGFYSSVGPKDEPALKYQHEGPPLASRHNCTDIPCGLIFFLALGFTGYILQYAVQHGDPRKVTHGMDYQGNLCGVDLPFKQYVYWCKKGPDVVGSLIAPLVDLDFHHPICVETCPTSDATTTSCYDKATGLSHLVGDYATHPVAKKYCMPQSMTMLDKVNSKMAGHPVNKYLMLAVSTVREGYPVLLGSFVLAFILSMSYLLVIECCAGLVLWNCIVTMIALPAASGGYLLYVNQNGGADGMPGSGDATTDLYAGIACCSVSFFFIIVVCCMRKAVARAIASVEAAAACLFSCKSLLLEPINNLIARMVLWAVMLYGFAYLVSVGEIRTSKIYRTFSYTTEEWIYLCFYVFMMIWLNDLVTAVSQYAIANAASRWFFTEFEGGNKNVGSCLLCKGYCNVVFHFGSLALGSCAIALTRPVRIVVVIFVSAADVLDNAVCGCLAKCCGCCFLCFDRFLHHLSKNAYIEMAITSKSFCAAGADAASLMKRQGGAMAVNAGATWLFTFAGLGAVTGVGAFLTGLVVQNVDPFNNPGSIYYIADPVVCAVLAGCICYFVALCFMLVFDSLCDTMLICLAYDREEQARNPVPHYKAPPPPPQQSVFASFFRSQPENPKAPAAVSRPTYASAALVEHHS